ncbi:MAG: 4-hydroxy-3-methylbut-2-enyl diphosphate reductase [Bacteroidia bacterium]
MKSFNIPVYYRSEIISRLKTLRKIKDPKKKDFTPSVLDFGPVEIYIARHFGFCYGVENAVEISFRAVDENPGKRIFMLSQMIHNPEVNKDLTDRGVRFLMSTSGEQLIPWEELTSDDIVIIPAFGTTLDIEKKLKEIGINPLSYNTTCPFVERVWKKSHQLGEGKYTIIIHGKPEHEETRATFSHSAVNGPSVVIKNMEEAIVLSEFITGKRPLQEFSQIFGKRVSGNFNPAEDLTRVGVINQTTMLATETQAIADFFKKVMEELYGTDKGKEHFADTRDTLCYATNENQDATYGLLEKEADIAIVVGGYNSSNTSHLVELCERKFPTYFIKDDSELISAELIRHFDLHSHEMKETGNWRPATGKARIILTSGASCPDSIIERVLNRLLSFYENTRTAAEVLAELEMQ